ncbi:MAG: bifunctional 4-hydroxy-2-oxoglutarate aldolase/2-dehydro-3-deoxy-phosphogluconate aldolase [Cyanobacteria bacterium P01_C01_bin.72]
MVASQETAEIRLIKPWLKLLQQHKAIAVIRCPDFHLAYKMAQSAAAGGINLIEITWNSDRPGELIRQLRQELPHCTIGTGTILTLEQLHSAATAGAQFAFSPCFDQQLLTIAHSRYNLPFIPGVFTPTEAVAAWQRGARVVKVFPIKSLGGADYIRCLQGPLSHIPLIPTGGVTVENAPQMIRAGAIAVGISSNLFPPRAIANQQWSLITNRTKNMLQQLQNTNSETNY